MSPQDIQQAQDAREVAHKARNEDLLSFLLGLRAHAVRLFRKAEADGDLRCAAVILREIRELVGEQAKLRIADGRGELDAKTIDVLELSDEELIRIAGNAPARLIGGLNTRTHPSIKGTTHAESKTSGAGHGRAHLRGK